jgi:beta-fructofuranosidase
MALLRALHFRPVDGWFGDPIPYFWDGVYHIYYMRGFLDGAPSWGHLKSTDCVHWQVLPDALTPGQAGSPDESGCWTGSIIEKDGVFHLFYTGVGTQGQTICRATSRDLIQWEKDANNPIVLPNPAWYEEVDWRDPSVICAPDGSGYWMLIGAREKRQDDIYPYNACVAFATSPDLEHWEVQPPFAASGVMYMDCPDLFQLGDQWCLLLALRETSIRLSDSPRGPWRKMLRESPNSTWASAGKTMFDGRRRILVNFLSRRENQNARGAIQWGGRMLLPRELYLDAEGQPAVRCLQETLADYQTSLLGAKGVRAFSADSHDWHLDADRAKVEVPHSAAVALWRDAPPHFLFSGRISLSSPSTIGGIFIRANKEVATAVDAGYQILFEPDWRRVSMRPLGRWDTDDTIIQIAFDFVPGKPIPFQLFVDGFVMELFLDERFAMCANLYEFPTGGLALMAREGEVIWDQMRIATRYPEPND